MKQLLIWDIDGTLMDCRGVGRLALNQTLEMLHGIRGGFSEINFSGTIDRQILDEAKRIHDLASFDESAFWAEYEGRLRAEIQKNPEVKMLKGIGALLERLCQEEDLFQMVSTGNARTGAMVKLQETALAPYFTHGVYGDEASDRSALVALAIERAETFFGHRFAAPGIFVIGDTPLDIQAALDNGVTAVAVATGRYSTGTLKSCGAHYVFDGLEEADPFLRMLGRAGNHL